MTRALRLLWIACLAVALSACGGGGDDDQSPSQLQAPWQTVVDTDFSATGPNGWFTCDQAAVDCPELSFASDSTGTGYGVSSAPWWLDPNHAAPGLGYVNLVAFAYHADCVREGIIASSIANAPIDLRNARLTVRWRAQGLQLPASAQLMFWFQNVVDVPGANSRRYVNHVLRAKPLLPAAAGGWQTEELILEADNADYACLGSAPDRAGTYGCDIDAATALRDWNLDLGFIVLFPTENQASSIRGAVEFDRIAIEIPSANLATHAPVAGFAPTTVRCGP
jgi:hypothetical protein